MNTINSCNCVHTPTANGSTPVIGSGQLGSLSKCESSTFENKEKVAAICLILVLKRCMIAQNVRRRVQNKYIMLKMTFKMFLGVSTYYYAQALCADVLFLPPRELSSSKISQKTSNIFLI